MSPRSSSKKKKKSSGASGPNPPADVFVGLLVVSVAALIGGITFLCLELNAYEWKMP